MVLVGFLISGLALILWHASREGHATSRTSVAIALVSFAIAGVGLLMSRRWGRSGPTLLYALSSMLLLFGIATILTIGIVLLALALIAFVTAVRRSAAAEHPWGAIIGGLVFGIGVVPLAAIALSPALAQCAEDSYLLRADVRLSSSSNETSAARIACAGASAATTRG